MNEDFSMSSFEWMELQGITNDIELSRSRLVEARRRGDRGRVRALGEEIDQAEKSRVQLLAHISTNIGSTPEPAPQLKARDGAGSDRAFAPAAEAFQDNLREKQPLEPTSFLEPVLHSRAKDGASFGQASAPAGALQDEANDEQPLALGSAAEPAPRTKARASTGFGQASAPATEPAQDVANAEQPFPDRIDRIVTSGAGPPAPALKAGSEEGEIIVWDKLTPSDIERAKNEVGLRRAEMLARQVQELKGLEAEQGQLETLERAIDIFFQKINQSSPKSTTVRMGQGHELRH
jgi:hypothetical protein